MSNPSLSGRRILVTRPAAQAEALCAAIVAQGGEPVRLPLLGIGPAEDTAELAAIVPRLDEFDLAFFVSPNAIQYALDFILPLRAWPATLAVATVGKGSAASLHARGFDRVISPPAGFDSEAVLALDAFSASRVVGRKVLILRGNGGRPLLGETLRARHAQVEYVSCYRRWTMTYAEDELAALVGALDALTLTSTEAVAPFAAQLQGERVAVLRRLPVFVPHERIAEAARGAGFATVVTTAPADAGLLAGMASYFSNPSNSLA